MADEGTFVADLNELDRVIAEAEATERALERLTNQLEAQMRTLQSQWEGLAADAQKAAHATWENGLRDMRAALGDLRAAARVAHANYSHAAHTNLEIWESMS